VIRDGWKLSLAELSWPACHLLRENKRGLKKCYFGKEVTEGWLCIELSRFRTLLALHLALYPESPDLYHLCSLQAFHFPNFLPTFSGVKGSCVHKYMFVMCFNFNFNIFKCLFSFNFQSSHHIIRYLCIILLAIRTNADLPTIGHILYIHTIYVILLPIAIAKTKPVISWFLFYQMIAELWSLSSLNLTKPTDSVSE
jgi:hypothetical protein